MMWKVRRIFSIEIDANTKAEAEDIASEIDLCNWDFECDVISRVKRGE